MSTKIKRKNITFIDRIADVFIVLEWLRQHYLNVGSEIYNKSLPVKELHGTGFFGVNNEVFAGPANVRWTTDILGFKQDRIQHIYFRSESCETLQQSQAKFGSKKKGGKHRVEHCNEAKEVLWKFLEDTYVKKGEPLDFARIGEYIIENAIVCLIEQSEEKTPTEIIESVDEDKPFTRYHAPIFYNGHDVSALTRAEIMDICRQERQHVLPELEDTSKIEKAIDEAKKLKYTSLPESHTFCPHDIATTYATNEYELLNRWYTHKRDKILKATSGKWYKPKFEERYVEEHSKKTCKPMSMVV